jgi:3-methyladenine DNA glycosylase AlkD
MARVRAPLDPVADLKRRLGREKTDKAKAFWTRYLRGAAKFRGVPMAKVRSCTQRWWAEHELADHPASVGKRIAIALLEQPMTEDKLAGVVVLHELIGDSLRATDVPTFARLFARGHLADWNIVDWFSTKVLARLLATAPQKAETAHALAQWRTAETVWQRRASCIAFAKLAPEGETALPGICDLVFKICGTVVWSPERFDQTAVGWVLRELSRAEPARVETFFRRYALLMSKECARYAVAKLPAEKRLELLALHRRATSLRSS